MTTANASYESSISTLLFPLKIKQKVRNLVEVLFLSSANVYIKKDRLYLMTLGPGLCQVWLMNLVSEHCHSVGVFMQVTESK